MWYRASSEHSRVIWNKSTLQQWVSVLDPAWGDCLASTPSSSGMERGYRGGCPDGDGRMGWYHSPAQSGSSLLYLVPVQSPQCTASYCRLTCPLSTNPRPVTVSPVLCCTIAASPPSFSVTRCLELTVTGHLPGHMGHCTLQPAHKWGRVTHSFYNLVAVVILWLQMVC